MEQDKSEQSWIEALKAGDEAAAEKLFTEYFQRLVRLARQKLKAFPDRIVAPSDIVQNALASFFQGMRAEAFPQLHDRENLWQVLAVITARKVAHTIRDQNRQKRGGGRVLSEAGLDAEDAFAIAQVMDDACDPEMACIFQEEVTTRLDQLNNAILQEIAVLKLEGYTNAEIAERLGCVPRTIERKLRVIRTIWEKQS